MANQPDLSMGGRENTILGMEDIVGGVVLGATKSLTPTLMSAVTKQLNPVSGATDFIRMPGTAAQTISITNNSPFYIYVNNTSATPATVAMGSIKVVRPNMSSVFPIGPSQYITFLVSTGPAGQLGYTPIDAELITVSASPLPSPVAQDVPIQNLGPAPTANTVTSAPNTAGVIVLPGNAGIGIRVLYITQAANGAGVTPGVLTITDGIINWGAPVSNTNALPGLTAAVGILFGAGLAVTVTSPAAGGAVTTTTSVTWQFG